MQKQNDNHPDLIHVCLQLKMRLTLRISFISVLWSTLTEHNNDIIMTYEFKEKKKCTGNNFLKTSVIREILQLNIFNISDTVVLSLTNHFLSNCLSSYIELLITGSFYGRIWNILLYTMFDSLFTIEFLCHSWTVITEKILVKFYVWNPFYLMEIFTRYNCKFFIYVQQSIAFQLSCIRLW